MSRVTRRRALALSTGGVLALALQRWTGSRAYAQTPAVRHDLKSQDGQEMLRIYAAAVRDMNDSSRFPEGSPQSWLFQWYTHGVRGDTDKAAEIARIYGSGADANRDLANEMWDTCEAHFDPSRADYFLPWHRMYLLYFEQIVRVVSGRDEFTLPYWDYTDPNDQVLPAAFRRRNDPDFGALFRSARRTAVNNGQSIVGPGGPLTTEAMIDTAYTDTGGSAGFCRNLDGGLHGAIHVNIGTSRGMGAIPFAASDPIFWIHHCSIDRVWASWNRAGGRNPTDATFLDEAFVFADGNGQRVRRTVGEMIDASPRDYVYDRYLDRPEDSPPFSEQPFVVASRSFASRPSASGVQLGAGARRVELDTGVATGAPVPRSRRFSAPAPAAPGAPKRRYYLRLEDVRTNAPPGIGYDVYINVPQGGRPTRSDAGYAGTINFFGSVPHEHSGHARRAGPVRTNNVSLDVTRVVGQLRAQGRDTGGLSVTLVPVGTPNANTTPTIGRISLMS